jgi:hypothetical protein
MPLYEAALDLSNEAEVAAYLAVRWQSRTEKLEHLHPYDYAVYDRRGVLCGCVEIKCRRASYPTYRIGLQKWRRMLEFSRRTGIPGCLVVRWPVNGAVKLLLAPVIPRPHGIVMGGRRDRGNPLDIEEMVEIPMSEFEDLNPDENVSRETV